LDPANGKKTGKWKPEEDAKLKEAVKKHGKHWVAVAKLVPGRKNIQCCQRWIFTLDPANGKKTGKWTPEEDAKLIEAVKKHDKNWVAVAAMVSGRTNNQCHQRWTNTVDPANGGNKGQWTAEEDAKLTEAVEKHGKAWAAVAAMVPDRTNNQCCQRWTNTVDPANGKKKGQWTAEEDAKLTEAVKTHGTYWVAVSTMVPGRTREQCRQRWARHLDPDRASNSGGRT
jgi:myb proto-oncogene protein